MGNLRHALVLLLTAGPLAAAPPAYDSAFTGYRAYQEPKVAPWKETNEKLGKAVGAGGHAAHGMKAAGDAPPVAAPPKPAKAPAADPHAGHNH